MPFEKGNQLYKLANNPGRKVYELEQDQLAQMKRIIGKDMKWLEEMQEKRRNGEKIDSNTLELMKVTSSRVNKMMDKLHASKQDVTSDGKQINIVVAKEIAEQNDLKA